MFPEALSFALQGISCAKLHASDPVGGFTSFVAAPAREEKHFSQEKRHGCPNDQETHEHAF